MLETQEPYLLHIQLPLLFCSFRLLCLLAILLTQLLWILRIFYLVDILFLLLCEATGYFDKSSSVVPPVLAGYPVDSFCVASGSSSVEYSVNSASVES